MDHENSGSHHHQADGEEIVAATTQQVRETRRRHKTNIRKASKRSLFSSSSSASSVFRPTSCSAIMIWLAMSSLLRRNNSPSLVRAFVFAPSQKDPCQTHNAVHRVHRFSSMVARPVPTSTSSNSNSQSLQPQSSSSSRYDTHLEAAAPRRRGLPRRQDFYSIDEIVSRGDGREYPPAVLDSTFDEDEGFGAYDYDATLDLYDQASMQEERELTVNAPRDYTSVDKIDDDDDISELRGERVQPPQAKKLSPSAASSSSAAEPKTSHLKAENKTTVEPTIKATPVIEKEVSAKSESPVVDEKVELPPPAPSPSPNSSPFPPRDAAIPPTYFTPSEATESGLNDFLSKASHGHGAVSSVDFLENDLNTIEAAIYQQNNGREFNINAPKQVALALFGPDGAGQSTRRDILEGMAAAGNRMADLILQYRTLKNRIKKLKARKESEDKGIAVRSASTVARPKAPLKLNPQQTEESEDTGFSVENVELQDQMSDPLILMDVSAFIFRAYYSMPPMHRGDGMPTGAVMGFCNTLNSMFLHRMLGGEQPRLVLCFDAVGKTFRDELYSEYKANRDAAPMDLVPQFELIREAARAYGICQIEASNYEADDVIATLSTMAVKEGMDTNILSGDKDLMQLITDLDATPSIQLIDPIKKTRSAYPQVIEKWGVPPRRLGDVLALAGDSADNIPGVRGIGPKTAAKLVNEFGSLDDLLGNLDDVKQKGWREKLIENKENARLSRELVELNRDVPMDHMTGFPDGVTRVSKLRMEPMDSDRMLAFYDQMGFRSLKRTLQGRLKGKKLKKPPSRKRPKATVPRPEDYADVPF